MNAPTVFRNGCGTNGYRFSVSTIIADIENATGDSLIDIAENIGTTRETISNAKNGKTSLSAEFLARIGKHYGGAFLNPYLALFGAQAAPLEQKRSKDIHPIVARVSHKLAMASDPDGPGGVVHVPQERLGYLPDLKELTRETACKVAEIEAALA